MKWLLIGVALTGCDLATGLDDLEGRESRRRFELVRLEHYGGPGAQHIDQLELDRDDNLHLAGTVEGTIDFGGGALGGSSGRHGVVAQLRGDGSHVWSQSWVAEDLRVHDLALSRHGEVALVGEYQGTLELGASALPPSDGVDGFVCVFVSDGTMLHLGRVSGGGAQPATRVVFSSASWVMLGGTFDTEAAFEGFPTLAAAGATDVWLARYGLDGYWKNTSALGDGERQALGALAADTENRIVVAGTASGAVDFAPARISHGASDLFIAQLLSDLTPRWSAMIGDAEDNCLPECPVVLASSEDGVMQLAAAMTGGGELGSSTDASAELLATRVGADGIDGGPVIASSRSWPGAGARPSGIAVDRDGNVVLTGWFDGGIDFGGGPLAENDDAAPDVFVVGYDRDGAHRFSLSLPIHGDVALDDAGPAVAVDREGRVIVGGSFRGRIDILGEHLESAGAEDADSYVAVIAPP